MEVQRAKRGCIELTIFANNKQIFKKMKAKAFKSKDWVEDLPKTIVSAIFLLFTVLTGFGVIDGNQVAEATPLVSSTVGAVATAVSGVIALVGIFFKKNEPVA